MEDTYTISLALVDYLPNIAFLIGAYFLIRLAYLTKSRLSTQLMTLGSVLVLIAGVFKATWKLVLALNGPDIRFFDEALFILQAPGFSLMLIGSIRILRSKVIHSWKLPAIALWKIPLLAVVTISSLGMYGVLVFLSFKKGLHKAAWCFILTILIVLGMSGMASGGDQTIGRQWIEEGFNILGQGLFAIGSVQLFSNFRFEIDSTRN